MTGQLMDNESVIRFVNGGKAIFTLVSKKTGQRYTYKVSESSDGEVFFVALLSGPDNTEDYSFIGFIRDGAFRHSRKARVGVDAPSFRAFDWFYRNLESPTLLAGLEVWHEGKCCRCGRTLTVPSSIAIGIGPECAGKLGLDVGAPIMGMDDLERLLSA